MNRLVLKFGGTSVANSERIARVADIVAAGRAETRAIAVVVSAMSGTTNQLVEWTKGAAGPDPGPGPRARSAPTGRCPAAVASVESRAGHSLELAFSAAMAHPRS